MDKLVCNGVPTFTETFFIWFVYKFFLFSQEVKMTQSLRKMLLLPIPVTTMRSTTATSQVKKPPRKVSPVPAL